MTRDQKLYVCCDAATRAQTGPTRALGVLKTGDKNLFFFARDARAIEMTPRCVLDFYVHESAQRSGVGTALFDFFLREERANPARLAYDRPSEKLLAFLKKNHGLSAFQPQSNNFVVFEAYFAAKSQRPASAANALRRLTEGRGVGLAAAARAKAAAARAARQEAEQEAARRQAEAEIVAGRTGSSSRVSRVFSEGSREGFSQEPHQTRTSTRERPRTRTKASSGDGGFGDDAFERLRELRRRERTGGRAPPPNLFVGALPRGGGDWRTTRRDERLSRSSRSSLEPPRFGTDDDHLDDLSGGEKQTPSTPRRDARRDPRPPRRPRTPPGAERAATHARAYVGAPSSPPSRATPSTDAHRLERRTSSSDASSSSSAYRRGEIAPASRAPGSAGASGAEREASASDSTRATATDRRRPPPSLLGNSYASFVRGVREMGREGPPRANAWSRPASLVRGGGATGGAGVGPLRDPPAYEPAEVVRDDPELPSRLSRGEYGQWRPPKPGYYRARSFVRRRATPPAKGASSLGGSSLAFDAESTFDVPTSRRRDGFGGSSSFDRANASFARHSYGAQQDAFLRRRAAFERAEAKARGETRFGGFRILENDGDFQRPDGNFEHDLANGLVAGAPSRKSRDSLGPPRGDGRDGFETGASMRRARRAAAPRAESELVRVGRRAMGENV